MERIIISFSPTSHLQDHILLDRAVVPATTLLLEIGSKLSTLLSCKRVGLSDVYFLEPLVLNSANDEAHHLVALTVDARAQSLRLVGCDEDATVILVAKYFLPSASYDNAMLHPSQRSRGSPMCLGREEFYSKFTSFGYGHKGAFQTVDSVNFREGESVVEVSSASGMVDAAIDGVMQAFILKKLLAIHKDEDELSVPFAVKEVILSPDVHVPEKAVGSFNDTDFWLFSTSTEPLIHGKGLIFKKIHRPMPAFVPKLSIPVFVRATACRLPGGIRSLADLAKLVVTGRTSDIKIPAQRIPERNTLVATTTRKPLEGGNFLVDDIAAFDATFFGISVLEAKAMDPQHRLLLEVVYECFQQAGITNYMDCGFFVGQMGSEYNELPAAEPLNALGLIGTSNSVIAGRLNFFFDSQGPSEAIDTACSSSLVALKNAVDAIRFGRCERAVIAGSSLILSAAGLIARSTGNLLSIDGTCQTFDIDADGYGRADGIVAVLIDGKQNDGPYLAKVDAIEVNHGGRAAALTAPSSSAQTRLITKVVRSSGQRKIDYWECHGTGTALGDPIEVSSLQKALGRLNMNKTVYIGSLKANIGHCEGASGLAGLLKAIIVANECYAPPLPRFKLLNRNISIDDGILGFPLIGEDIPASSDEITIGVSSFGVSGTNAAVVVTVPLSESRKKSKQALSTHLSQLGIDVLPFSANTQSSLDALTEAFKTLVTTISRIDFQLLSAAAALTRPSFRLRSVFIKTGSGEIAQISMAQAQEFAFCVDFCQPVSWKLYYRNSGLRETFLHKLHMMTNNGEQITDQLIRIADVQAKWYWLHTIGVKCTQIAVNTEAEAIVGTALASAFDFAKVVNIHELAPSCVGVNSKAYPLFEPWHLNRVLASMYICSIDIDWNLVYSVPGELQSYLPTWMLPTYCFDRKRHWNKVLTNDFDNAFIGNVVESPNDKCWVLENLVLKRRLNILFLQTNTDKLKVALAIEIACAVGRLISNGGSFKLVEVLFTQLPELTLLEDNTWIRTIISMDKNHINARIVTIDVRRAKETEFATFTAILKDVQPRSLNNFDSLQKFFLDFNFFLLSLPLLPEFQGFQIEYNEREFNSDLPNCTDKKVTTFKVPVVRGGTAKIKFIKKAELKIKETTKLVERISSTARQAIIDVLKGTVLDAIGCDIELSNKEFITKGFMDLGMDSLSMMGFLTELNTRHFPTAKLTTTDLFTHANIQNLANVIAERIDSTMMAEGVIYSSLHPPSTETSPYRPSASNAWDVIAVTHQTLAPTDISLCYNENQAIAEANCSEFSFDIGIGDSFDVFVYKLSELMLPEVRLVFLFKPSRLIEPTDKNRFSETVQFVLLMAKALSKLKTFLKITVIQNDNPVSGFFAGFWKSFAVEKQRCEYNFFERISPTKASLPILKKTNEPKNIWIVTGGTDGIGLVMARHLAKYPFVETVYAVSRRGIINSMNTESKKLVPIAADVSHYDEFFNVIKLVKGKIDGIIHSAGTVEDAIVERQNLESFKKVITPKVIGMNNVLRAMEALGHKPRFVILNSSISSVFGNFGQTNYAAANAATEKLLAQYRALTGVGSIIHWGNWNDVGMASDTRLKSLLQSYGFIGLSSSEGVTGLDFVIGTKIERVVIAKLNRFKLIKARIDLADVIVLEEDSTDKNLKAPLIKCATLQATMPRSTASQNQNQFENKVVEEITNIVHDEIQKITKQPLTMPVLPDMGFMEAGLDSITMYAFAQGLTNRLSKYYPNFGRVNIINLFEHPTPRKLIAFLKTKLPQDEPSNIQKALQVQPTVPQATKAFEPKANEIKTVLITPLNSTAINAHIIKGEIILPGAFEIDTMLRTGTFSNLKNIILQRKTNASNLSELKLSSCRGIVHLQNFHNETISKAEAVFESKQPKMPKMIPFNKKVIAIDRTVFYKSLELRGVAYGFEFVLLTNIETDGDIVIAGIQIHKQCKSLPPWVLIESGMQALIAAAERRNGDGSVLLPARIQAVNVSSDYLQLKSVGGNFCKNFEIYGVLNTDNERFVEGDVWVSDGTSPMIEILDVIAVKQKPLNHRRCQSLVVSSSKQLQSNCQSLPVMNIKSIDKSFKINKSKTITNINVLSYACQLPNEAEDVPAFWRHLNTPSKQSIGPFFLSINPAFFDPATYGITPKEAPFIDPQQRLLMKNAKEALEAAAISIQMVPKSTGIFIGTSSSDFAYLCATEVINIPDDVKGYLASGTNSSCMAGRLAHWLKTSGPAITVDTGCSSFAVALSLAADALSRGDIEYAIVGSANLMFTDNTSSVLEAAKMLSPNGQCATFSEDANGYARSEAIVVVVLGTRKIDDGIKLTGWAVNHNGGGAAMTVPNSEAQIAVIKAALTKANINHTDVDVVECHGTGTVLGDPIEVASVLKVFTEKKKKVILTATKAHIGHAEAAASGIAFVAACEMLKNNYIPPQPYIRLINAKIQAMPNFDKLVIPQFGIEKNIQSVLVNSFGFSGTNGSFVLNKIKPSFVKTAPNKHLLINGGVDTNTQNIINELKIQKLPSVCRAIKPEIITNQIRTSIVLHPLNQNPTIVTQSISCLPNFAANIVLVTLFSYPSMFLAELTLNNCIIAEVASNLQTLCAELEIESANVFLNALLIAYLEAINLKVKLIVYPTDFDTNCRQQLQSLITHVGLINIDYSFELPAESKTSVFAFGSLFEDPENNEIYRPSEALNNFLAQIWRNGVDLDLPVITLPIKPKAEGHKDWRQYWCLEHPCRSQKWYEAGLLRRGLFKLIEVFVPLANGRGQLENVTLTAFEEESVKFAMKIGEQLSIRVAQSVHPDTDSIFVVNGVIDSTETALKLCKSINKTSKKCIVIKSCDDQGCTALVKSINAERNHENAVSQVVIEDLINLEKVIYTVLQRPGFYKTSKGKLMSLKTETIPAPKLLPIPTFNKVLITGGTGGIASAIAEVLTANEILLVSRSAKSVKTDLTDFIKKNTRAKLVNLDVTDARAVQRFFSAHCGIDCIIHCAGLIDNALSTQLTLDQFQRVAAPKINGIRNLLQYCESSTLKKLIAMSSIASIEGSFGQANYAWANGVMERLIAESSFPESVEKLIVAWGPWSDIGMLAGEDKKLIRGQIKASGLLFMKPKDAVKAFLCLLPHSGTFVVREVDVHPARVAKQTKINDIKQTTFLQAPTVENISQLISHVSGIQNVDPNIGLMTLGLDSLMIEDFRTQAEDAFGVNLSLPDIYGSPTVAKLAKIITKKTSITLDSTNVSSHIPQTLEFNEDVAIIAYSGTVSGCDTVPDFWDAIFSKTDLSKLLRFQLTDEALKFDGKMFNMPQHLAEELDVQTKLALKHAHICLENGGYIKSLKANVKIACFGAAEPITLKKTTSNAKANDLLTSMYAKNAHNFLPVWISHLLDLRGPSATVYSACSSTLSAIQVGIQCLKNTDVDACLIVTASVPLSDSFSETSGIAVASKNCCRPFDKHADGIVPGAAVGALLLKRAKLAIMEDNIIHAIIKGVQTSNDGFAKANFMAPGMEGQIAAMQISQKFGHLDYVECHATGTAVGDKLEIAAMEQAYSRQTNKIAIGSVKANVGHCFAAAGMISIFKVLGIFERGELPEQVNLLNEIDEIKKSKKFYVVRKRQQLKHSRTLRATVHAFGIGGTDGCLVIESGSRKPSTKLNSANVAFFFAPQGIQYANMLIPTDFVATPSAKVVYDHLITTASNTFDRDFAEVMASPDLIEKQEYAQVALFIVLMTLSRALNAAGIHASVALGHSLGEYAALCFAGAIPPADVVQLLAIRSKLMAKTAAAKMLSFKTEVGKTVKIPKNVEISAYLSQTVKVVVGCLENMDAFAKDLTKKKIEFRWLRTSKGFHSSMMDPIVPKFQTKAVQFDHCFGSTRIPVISNRDGSIFDKKKLAAMSSYLGQHLRDPVRIDKSLDTLLETFPEVKIIVNVGPPGMLANLLLQRGRKDIRVIQTLPTKNEAEKMPSRNTPIILKIINELHSLNIVKKNTTLDKTVNCNIKQSKSTTLSSNTSSFSQKLATFWSEALGTIEPDVISPDLNFFALGGNSLSAVQLCWKIEEELSLSVPVTLLIDNPTFGAFCNVINNMDSALTTRLETSPLLPFKENTEYPLSPAQEQMFILYHLKHDTKYNIVFSIRLQPLPGKKFETNVAVKTIHTMIEHQTSLRTVFFQDSDGVGCQKIVPMSQVPKVAFIKVDLAGFEQAVKTEKTRKFDLAKKAFSIKGFELPDGKFAILISQHHIITDGWSMTIFGKQFSTLYSIIMSKKKVPLQSDVVQYCQLSTKLQKLSENVDFSQFAKTLASLEASELQTTCNSENQGYSTIFQVINLTLLSNTALTHSTTPSMIALTAFAQTVAIWTEHQQMDHLLFGVASSGRTIPETRDLIGYFLNNSIFAVPDKKKLFNVTIANAIAFVKATLTKAQCFEVVPYHRLVAQVRKYSSQPASDLFKIYFNYRHSLDFPTVNIPGVTATVIQETSIRIFDLAVTLDEINDGKLQITADFNKDVYDESMVFSFLSDFVKQIKALGTGNNHQCKVSSVVDVTIPKKTGETVATVIANIAEAYPHRTALVKPNGAVITYHQLILTAQSRAVSIKKLFKKNIERDLEESDVIPLIMDFNEHPEWLLAVMFAGACYAPIDSSYSTDYIETLIHLIGAKFCVVSDDSMFQSADNVFFSTTKINEISTENFIRWNSSTDSSALMYVLFTSGSTGTPKAVPIMHHNVLTFLETATKQLSVSPLSVIAHTVNTIFDVSVFNIFGAWTTGATLKQFSSIRKAATDLDLNVTHLFLTSAVFNALLERRLERLARHQRLEYLIIGGETPNSASLKKFLQLRDNSLPKLIQIYGPTETTVWVTMEEMKNDQACIIGTANNKVELFLTALDNTIKIPKDSGAIGEICIAGDQLARGYFDGNSDGFKTLKIGEKYVQVFATGDFGQWMLDGRVKFIGRKSDGFVKRNGMRIDLKLIENAIKNSDVAVVDVAVLLVERSLVGFITTETATELRSFKLKTALNLPLDFVPDVLLELKVIPITLSGKRNHPKLAEIAKTWISAAPQTTNYALKTERSVKLAEIWTNILKTHIHSDIIMLDSDFFALGGSSIDLFRLQQQIENNFECQVDIDKLYKFPKFVDQLNLLLTKKDTSKTEQLAHVIEIRRAPSPIASVYCLHAIGGTVYPFYTLDTVIQDDYNIFGMPFDINYPAESLIELANFYSQTISSHSTGLPLVLLGHSLGGALAHLIAHIFLENNKTVNAENKINVIMFDTWCLAVDELNLSLVKEYMESQFSHISEAGKFVSQSMRLASFMQHHKFEFDPRIGVLLFKASTLTASPLRKAVMPTLTPEIARSFVDNGWTQYSASVTTTLTSGDHDSLLKAENLAAVRITLQKAILKSTFTLK